MESSFKEIPIEDLLKLLGDSYSPNENHPFPAMLRKANIKPGDKLVKVQTLIKVFNKKISVNYAVELCRGYLNATYIQGIPYFKINKKKNVKKRETGKQTAKKYQNFLEATNLSSGDTSATAQQLYQYYDAWAYTTKKKNEFTKEEFIKISKIWLKYEYGRFMLNKDITNFVQNGEVATWRKRAKKEKA